MADGAIVGEIEIQAVRPGSTTVEVDLDERDGVTRLTLTHRGLDAAMRPPHDEGWGKYLARLTAAAEESRP
jgi:Activator of Hsp90 ATPase homolog 1-like protein